MTQITMRALASFEFNGRQYEADEEFTVAPIEAAALRHQGKADFAVGEAPKPKRRYRRRDMQPEP